MENSQDKKVFGKFFQGLPDLKLCFELTVFEKFNNYFALKRSERAKAKHSNLGRFELRAVNQAQRSSH